MTLRLDAIQRFPIKAHGSESLEHCAITPDQCLPYDREWAVAHEAAKLAAGWSSCHNFTRGAKAPALMAIKAQFEEAAEQITLTHPDRPDLTFSPTDPSAAATFIEWTKPLIPEDRAQPVKLVRQSAQAHTDTPFPSISLLNMASNTALSETLGVDLSPLRWRGNFWVSGMEAWEEFSWVGREVSIGTATFKVEERITRCRATMASPDTGKIDTDTLSALKTTYGHQDFGIYLRALTAGEISVGDSVTLL